MLALLSPAKSLDYQSELLTKRTTKPRFTASSAQLIAELRKLSVHDLGQLMSISDKLAQLNYDRYASWEEDSTKENSRQAILAFTGDVYQGLTLPEWSAEDFNTAQKKLRILSGLYGLIRPLDLMQPYRLEMGTRLTTNAGKNLYQFWADTLTRQINKDLKNSGSDTIVNLASKEYFSAVQPENLHGTLVTPVFKDQKNGTYKIIAFHAKKARGMMADFIVRKNATHPESLKEFSSAGYQFSPEDSDHTTLLFTRPEAAS